jgi:hypothetical protein
MGFIPTLWLYFTPSYCALRTSKDDEPSTQAFNKIRGILEERSVKVLGLLQSLRFWIGYVIVLTAAFSLYRYFGTAVLAWVYIVAFLFPLIFWPFTFALWGRQPNVVALKYRRDSPTFWEDNLGDIVKWVFITVLAGVLLLLATRAINQVLPEAVPKP